jgi:periplasmic copper chaperone A
MTNGVRILFFLILGVFFTKISFAEIQIQDPWVRASTGPNAALFMKITNTSQTPAQLIGAQVGTCDRCELHTHVENNGIFRMVEVESFEIPARGHQELKPGEHHVMLMKIREPLKEGDMVPVTLTFAGGERVEVTAPVKASALKKCCCDH